MDHAQNDAEFFAQFQKETQQSDGIRAAGNGDADALTRAEEVPLFCLRQQDLRQKPRHDF
jgi:hypothetical protein